MQTRPDERVVVADLTDTPPPTFPGLPEGIALSPSRANDFLTCPLMFRFRAIDKLPERPTSAAVRGTLVHAVLESLFDCPAATRTLDRAKELVRPTWDQLLESKPELAYALVDAEFVPGQIPSVDDKVTDTWLRGANPLLAKYFELEDPALLTPSGREVKLDVTVRDGLPLRGIVDRIDIAPGNLIRVVDYKTGRAPGPGFEQKAMFQMRFYALMIARSGRSIPRRLQLMYLGDGQVLHYEPTESDLATFETKLAALWKTITAIAESGDWRPRVSSACDRCDHQMRCPEKGGVLPPVPVEIAAKPTSVG